MAENFYEGLFILDANRYSRNPTEVSGKIPSLIEGQGGELLVSRLWEERRLAYPIKGQRKGTYWLTYFKIEGSKLTELSQLSERSDTILRHLFLKVDPRIVDTLVAHASAEGAAKPAEAASSASAPAKSDEAKPAAAPAKSDEAKPATASPAESEAVTPSEGEPAATE